MFCVETTCRPCDIGVGLADVRNELRGLRGPAVDHRRQHHREPRIDRVGVTDLLQISLEILKLVTLKRAGAQRSNHVLHRVEAGDGDVVLPSPAGQQVRSRTWPRGPQQ